MYQGNISFAGAGRVAAALCKGLSASGRRIDLVVSRTAGSGKKLAGECKAEWSDILSYSESTSIIIVAVADQNLENVLKSIKCSPGTLVAHTAGSFGLDIFPANITSRGVFYPLQTFSKNRKVSFSEVPFLIEASDEPSAVALRELAGDLSGRVHYVSSEQRRNIHLAAVFASNFTNHMLTRSKEVALNSNFNFEILYPLIRETISKAIESGPENSQTGPAIRNDFNTIEKHLELLSFSPELQRIYKELTLSISEYHNRRT